MLQRIQRAQRQLEKEWPTMLQKQVEELVHYRDRDLLAEKALDPVIEVVGVCDSEILHYFPELGQMNLNQNFENLAINHHSRHPTLIELSHVVVINQRH